MTPKEYANELYSKFDNLFNKDFMLPIVYDNQLKECALIAIDEILNEYWSHDTKRRDWWKYVKQEIENL
jgi:hypothetical protein